MSSAICFNLNQSKILLSGNGLNHATGYFPHNHYRNNGHRWERNDICRNDYHHSSERILVETVIEPATSCSQVGYTSDWAIGLGSPLLSAKRHTRVKQSHLYLISIRNLQLKLRRCTRLTCISNRVFISILAVNPSSVVRDGEYGLRKL